MSASEREIPFEFILLEPVDEDSTRHTGHIWIVDAATGAARKLAAHDQPYVNEVPAWFPDGKRIAFQIDRTGRVWLTNVDGSAQHKVTK